MVGREFDGIPQTKRFDGVVYKYLTSINGKMQAKSVAKTTRRGGWYVRVVPTSGSAYLLYVRNRGSRYNRPR